MRLQKWLIKKCWRVKDASKDHSRTGDLLATVQNFQTHIEEPTAACQPAQVNIIILDLLILDEQEHLFTLNSDLVILADGS